MILILCFMTSNLLVLGLFHLYSSFSQRTNTNIFFVKYASPSPLNGLEVDKPPGGERIEITVFQTPFSVTRFHKLTIAIRFTCNRLEVYPSVRPRVYLLLTL